jgi:hypothetical protein
MDDRGKIFLGAETLYIYIKKTCYEYELDWGYQSQVLTETPTPAPSTSLLGPREHIIRLELHPYEHWPLLKVLKRFIYIYIGNNYSTFKPALRFPFFTCL